MITSKALVLVPHDAALQEYLQVFYEQSYIEPVFYLDYDSLLIGELEKRGYSFYLKKRSSDKAKPLIFNKLAKNFFDSSRLGCWLQATLLNSFFSGKLIKQITNQASFFESIVLRESISNVVIATDRSLGAEASIIYLSKLLDLNVVLLSFAYSAGYEASYKLRDKKIYRYLSGQPENVVNRSRDLGDRAFYRPFETEALTQLGILPVNPWVLGGGLSYKMLVDSEREKNRLINLGGEQAKYLVTGLASHDFLFGRLNQKQSIKTKLQQAHNLKHEFNIVVSLPQYYEHSLCDKTTHFELIEEMVTMLSGLEANIILSLHPKMKYSNYEFLLKFPNVIFLRGPLSHSIVSADLFLATYSSTVSWAIMCNIPVVMFDHIGLNYTGFYSEFELPVVYNNNDLLGFCREKVKVSKKQLVLCNYYKQDLVAQLSPFDGKCKDRILEGLISKTLIGQ